MTDSRFRSAAVVLPCRDLAATQQFFIDRLGMTLELIAPADDPTVAELSGHGLRIRLDRQADGDPGHLVVRTVGSGQGTLVAPNGTRIELLPEETRPDLAPLPRQTVVSRAGLDEWIEGRAGMLYRDLVPGRAGGRLVASHIRIPHGGPVPDYVHYHEVGFQLIFCHRGWVRVVYEDQGEPFVLNAGDCVTQPPGIRHRVLECSDGLEVIEIGSPAEHPTRTDPDMALPTGRTLPDRDFGGQRFVHRTGPEVEPRNRCLDLRERSGGVAEGWIHRLQSGATKRLDRSDGESCFIFVRQGSVAITVADEPFDLAAESAAFLPPGAPATVAAGSADAEILRLDLQFPER